MEASFDQLPYSVHQIHDKLDKIEQLLLSRSNDPQPEEDKLLYFKRDRLEHFYFRKTEILMSTDLLIRN